MTEDSVSANSNLLGDSSTHYLGDHAPCCGQPHPELGDHRLPIAIQGKRWSLSSPDTTQ